MADITYCIARDCPFKKCKRHWSKLKKIENKDVKVIVSNFAGVCREYIGYVLGEVERRTDNDLL